MVGICKIWLEKNKILKKKMKKIIAPGEARTHNLGLAQRQPDYKIRALSDCATGALWKKRRIFEERIIDSICNKFEVICGLLKVKIITKNDVISNQNFPRVETNNHDQTFWKLADILDWKWTLELKYFV